MKTHTQVATTSPNGIWNYSSLLGAIVKIKSRPASTGLRGGIFGYDSEATWTIDNISFRMNQAGKAITVIKLTDLPGDEFTWKDLEIVGLRFGLYTDAVVGEFCIGTALVGQNKQGINEKTI